MLKPLFKIQHQSTQYLMQFSRGYNLVNSYYCTTHWNQLIVHFMNTSITLLFFIGFEPTERRYITQMYNNLLLL